MNIQYWFPLVLIGSISLLSKGLSGVFSSTRIWKHQFFSAQYFIQSNSYICTWLLENHSFDLQTFVGKMISLLFNMLSRFLTAFLPRTKCLLISWLQSPSAVILEPKKIKSVTVSIVFPSICHEVTELDAMVLVFWLLSFKPASSLSSLTFFKRLFSSSLSAIRVVSSAYLRLLIFLPEILILACASSSLAFHMIYSA